jgi:archaellum biogenesis ATPase FlaH
MPYGRRSWCAAKRAAASSHQGSDGPSLPQKGISLMDTTTCLSRSTAPPQLPSVIQAESVGNGKLLNSEFLDVLADAIPKGGLLWTTAFGGNPDGSSGWGGKVYDGTSVCRSEVDHYGQRNAYFSIAALRSIDDQPVKRRKASFARLLCLVVDDAHPDNLNGTPSWVLQTSPGKQQVGFLLDGDDLDCADIRLVDLLVTRMAEQGLIGGDKSGNNAVRYVRLPQGQNQKPRASGPFDCHLVQWNPQARYSLEDAAGALGIDFDEIRTIAQIPSNPINALSMGAIAGEQGDKLTSAARNIAIGENLHENINLIAASLIGSGSHAGSVVNILRGMMSASTAPKDDRWKARYDDIPRSVESASAKFSPSTAAETVPASLSECLVDVHEYVDPDSNHPCVVESIIPEGEVTLLAGHGGTGKSYIALKIAVHVAMGLALGPLATTRTRVAYFSAEDDSPELLRRLARICKSIGIEQSALEGWLYLLDVSEQDPTLFASDRSGYGGTPGLAALASFDIKEDVGLVVIDNASDTFTGEENSRAQVRSFMRSLRTQLARPNRAVLLLAHIAKAAAQSRQQYGASLSDDYSGSTAWHNSARSRLSLEPDASGVILKHLKANRSSKAEPLRFDWQGGVPVLDGGAFSESMRAFAIATEESRDAADREWLFEVMRDFEERDELVTTAVRSGFSLFNTIKGERKIPKGFNSDRCNRAARELHRLKRIHKTSTMRGGKVREVYVTVPGESPSAAKSVGGGNHVELRP